MKTCSFVMTLIYAAAVSTEEKNLASRRGGNLKTVLPVGNATFWNHSGPTDGRGFLKTGVSSVGKVCCLYL